MFVKHVIIQRAVKVNTIDIWPHLSTIYEQIRTKMFQKVPRNTRVIVVRNINMRRHYGITSRNVHSRLRTPVIITL